MEDIRVICIQCRNEFVFTAQDQEKYLKMGFNKPHRCPQCRKHKKHINEDTDFHINRDKKKHYRSKYE